MFPLIYGRVDAAEYGIDARVLMTGDQVLVGSRVPRFCPWFYSLFDQADQFVGNELKFIDRLRFGHGLYLVGFYPMPKDFLRLLL